MIPKVIAFMLDLKSIFSDLIWCQLIAILTLKLFQNGAKLVPKSCKVGVLIFEAIWCQFIAIVGYRWLSVSLLVVIGGYSCRYDSLFVAIRVAIIHYWLL